jgi:hypothetical protein
MTVRCAMGSCHGPVKKRIAGCAAENRTSRDVLGVGRCSRPDDAQEEKEGL